jgi:hypothetical protein
VSVPFSLDTLLPTINSELSCPLLFYSFRTLDGNTDERVSGMIIDMVTVRINLNATCNQHDKGEVP